MDITKCANEDCLLKASCFRYTATACEFRQSYSDYKPVDGECEYYWDNKGRDNENSYFSW